MNPLKNKSLRAPLLLVAASLVGLSTEAYSQVSGAIIVLCVLSLWTLFYYQIIRDLRAFLFAGITYFALNSTYFLLISSLKIRSSAGILVGVHLVVALLLYARITKLNRFVVYPSIKDALLPGVTLLGIGLVVFYYIITPFTGSGAVGVVSNLSVGEDNISHYSMHNSIVENSSMSFGVSPDDAGIISNLRYYPQGLHANFAFHSMLLGRSTDITQEYLLKSHAVQISLLYTVLVLTILLAIYLIIRQRLSPVISSLSLLTISPLAILYVSQGTLFYLFTFGFHSQIAAYIFTIGLLVTLWSKLTSTAKLTLLGLSTVGMTNSWYFMSPIFLAVILYWLVIERKTLVKNWRIALPIGIGVGVAALAPILIEATNAYGSSAITLSGAVWKVPVVVMVIMFFGMGTLIFWQFKSKDRVTNQFIYLLVISSVFSVLIGLYIKIKVGRLDYYYFKSVYTIVTIAIIGTGFYYRAVVEYVLRSKLSRLRIILIAAVVFISGLLLAFGVRPLAYANAYTAKTIARYAYSWATEKAIEKSYMENQDIIYLGFCDGGAAYINQRWAGAILLSESDARKIINLDHLYADRIDFNNIVNASNYSDKTNVFVASECWNEPLPKDQVSIDVEKL